MSTPNYKKGFLQNKTENRRKTNYTPKIKKKNPDHKSQSSAGGNGEIRTLVSR